MDILESLNGTRSELNCHQDLSNLSNFKYAKVESRKKKVGKLDTIGGILPCLVLDVILIYFPPREE